MIHLRPYLVPRSDNVLRFTEGDLGKNKMILEGEITDEKMMSEFHPITSSSY